MAGPEDLLQQFYDARADEEPQRDPEAEQRFRKAFDVAKLNAGERVLDVGAKWGGFGLHARTRSMDIDYSGLELSECNVKRAAELGLDVQIADATARLPVGSGSVDCVVCLELLEHLVEPLTLLQEIRRVLRPSGRAVLSVPNPYSWVEIYREFRRRPDPEGHVNSYTTPVMQNLLALAGMRLETRAGTSVRVPLTRKLKSTDSILARSRIFVARPSERVTFSGREFVAPESPA